MFFFIIPVVLGLLILARPFAAWIADRTGRTGEAVLPVTRSTHLSPAEQKMAQLQDQVTAKIHWDAPDHEVLEWLSTKHGIEGGRAGEMLEVARRARVRAIRERSIYGLIATGIGILGTGAALAVLLVTGHVWSLETDTLAVAFGSCVLGFGKYLHRFFSGTTDSTIDS